MVMAKLHTICGNCGCSDMFSYDIDHDEDGSLRDDGFVVRLTCNNCSTIHNPDDNITPPSKPKPEIDWSKVPEGTLVRVKSLDTQYWMIAEFNKTINNHFEVYWFSGNVTAFKQIRLHESVEPKEEWFK